MSFRVIMLMINNDYNSNKEILWKTKLCSVCREQ